MHHVGIELVEDAVRVGHVEGVREGVVDGEVVLAAGGDGALDRGHQRRLVIDLPAEMVEPRLLETLLEDHLAVAAAEGAADLHHADIVMTVAVGDEARAGADLDADLLEAADCLEECDGTVEVPHADVRVAEPAHAEIHRHRLRPSLWSSPRHPASRAPPSRPPLQERYKVRELASISTAIRVYSHLRRLYFDAFSAHASFSETHTVGIIRKRNLRAAKK